MDISELFSPNTLIIIVFALVLVGLKLYNDVRDIRSARRMRQLSAAYIKANNTPRISVMINLSRSAETIYPLLDHLYSHNYANLEVVIVIKHTAGKYAQKKLLSYRRKNRIRLLKLVKHAKGMTRESLIRQKTTGELVLLLSASDTLSSNFFTGAALDSLDNTAAAITPNHYAAIDTTFTSAQRAIAGIWAQILKRFTANNAIIGLQNGYIYRRNTLTNQRSMSTVRYKTTPAYQATIITSSHVMPQRIATSSNAIKRSLLVAVIVASLLVFLSTYNVTVFAQLLLLSYIFIFSAFTLDIKEYSIRERVTLILFVPFSIFIFVSLYANSALKCLITSQRRATTFLQITFDTK